MSNAESIRNSTYTGFIDSNNVSDEEYQPRLLINDAERGEKVLTCISRELARCDEFMFSVAFVTNSGVVTLLNILKELEIGNVVKGVIVASQYQNFTEPDALRALLRFRNIEVRIVSDGNLHSKGYIFRKGTTYSLIIGSSNLTQNALCQNKEWNLKVSSSQQGSLVINTLDEFARVRSCSTLVNESWIMEYEKIYKLERKMNYTSQMLKDVDLSSDENKTYTIARISPNRMQTDALTALQNVRDEGKNRALIISATGTGKTYLSAFDVRKFKAAKFLFVVHRENIANAAMKSFRAVVNQNIKLGLLCGYSRETSADYIFATIQTLSKDDILFSFEKDHFDYIVIDEVHRSGADSYQKVINYFNPVFLLGMTATPERTDGYDIFKLFHNNIAFEIRLQQAMRENMICPFHYFGVSELEIDGELISDRSEFRMLTSDARVNHIIEKIKFYGYSGNRVRGLVFCSRKEEAKNLSDLFNKRGYRTKALVGESTESERELAIQRIEQHESENALDYIFTVDIFNEGVDIPSINQVVMLRPTESAIIFVQQLGRGLRRTIAKEYVIVIDFIGNYENNFLIPIALSGDQSYNKDTIRRYIAEGNKVIHGCSTVNFDAITRERIYAALDKAKFNDVKLIKESYQKLKYRLNHIPELEDFEKYGSLDVLRIIDKFGSYHNFLTKHEKDYIIKLSAEGNEMVDFISQKFADGKRPHELVILKLLLYGVRDDFQINLIDVLQNFQRIMKNDYGMMITDKSIVSLKNILTNNFLSGSGKDTYKNCIFIEEQNNKVVISEKFKLFLMNSTNFDIISKLIQFGLTRWANKYSNLYLETNLQLYQKYTYEDVCRLLEWEKAEVALNIGGYKFDKKSKTYPVFINYHKEKGVNDSINYDDRFVSPGLLIALSKSGRSPESDDVVQAYRAEQDGVGMHLFVRRNKDDAISKEFYYLGKIRATGKPNPIVMKNTQKKAVEIHYQLHTPVREDIYDFITHWSE
jgi:superfamily II DNA or RNA helicase/HKD family nuclease